MPVVKEDDGISNIKRQESQVFVVTYHWFI